MLAVSKRIVGTRRAARLAFTTTARRSVKAGLNARFRWRFPQMRRCWPRYRDTGQLRLTRQTRVFNGKVNRVQIDLGKDVHDYFITPEERLNLAMTRQ